MIEVKNLSKEFKINKKHEGFTGAVKSLFSNEYTIKKAVNNMNFSIDKGELVGYIGVNGAGKSTTIKMMTGILVPTSGSCTINGIVPYENRRVNAQNIGVVFGQRTQLWWDLPVSESFNILQKIYDIPKARFQENLEFFKEILEIKDFFLTPVRNLSLGQKMRADFAASLLHDPKVLFLDEPTIGLDVLVKERIRKAIKEINKERDTTIILTTHDLDDIEEVCNRIILIDNGEKLYDGKISELKNKYNHYKVVEFDIKNNIGFDFNKFLNIDKNNLIIDESEVKLNIRFNHNLTNVSDIINLAVKNYDIKDVKIQEEKMEDIVKEIYRGKIKFNQQIKSTETVKI